MVTPLFNKLNFKQQSQILVIAAPDSFQEELKEMAQVTQVCTDITQTQEVEFVIVFVTKQIEIDQTIALIYPKLKVDAIMWYCYPKGTSKKYRCDFNRDTGWEPIGARGLEGVRMVAIDQDWSALRFRNVAFIKEMTRSKAMTISNQGLDKTKGK